MQKRNAGFTLVEMLLVVAIIATLAAMVVPRFTGRAKEAKAAAALADIRSSLSTALDLYESDNGFYPTTEQGLAALLEPPSSPPVPAKWRGPYLKRRGSLKDPWGNPYVYRCPGIHNPRDYDLSSAGPNGHEENSPSISNWEDPTHDQAS